MMTIRFRFQVSGNRSNDLHDVLARQQSRNPAQRQTGWTQRVQLEPRTLPLSTPLQKRLKLMRLQLYDNGVEQLLRGGLRCSMSGFESLVQNALMAGMHVDEHHPVASLRKNINAMQ